MRAQVMGEMLPDTDEVREAEATKRFRWLLLAGWLVPFAVLLMLAIYAAQYNVQKFISTGVICLLIGLAALVVGALLGFLFGIPRALQNHASTAEAHDRSTQYIVNTNLEQISDWLTKILVGVGLIQLGHIGGQFSTLSTHIGTDIGIGTSGQLIAGADMTFFSIWGFLLGYLLTRTYLTAAFRAFDGLDRVAAKAAQEAVSEVADTVAARAAQEVASEVSRTTAMQGSIDAEALSTASQLLKANAGGHESASPNEVKEFEGLLAKTSPPIREQIFQQMRAQRAANWTWRDENDDERLLSRERHERTLPIARALVKVDPADHRFHGELGFILKDKEVPEYREAVRELSTALDIAQRQGDERSVAWASVNRAQAQIYLGKQIGYAAPWPNRAEIWDDIYRAEEYGGTPKRIAHEQMFREWRAENPKPESVDGQR